MATTVNLDLADEGRAVENNGQVDTITRSAYVTITAPASNPHETLLLAFDAVDDADSTISVPAPGSVYSSTAGGYQDWRVTNRECGFVGQDSTGVLRYRIDLTYTYMPLDYWMFSETSAVQQQVTQLNRHGVQLEVTHLEDTRGVEASVFVPQGTMVQWIFHELTGNLTAGGIIDQWVGRVNNQEYLGVPPGQFLVVNGQAELMCKLKGSVLDRDASPIYKFTFELQIAEEANGFGQTGGNPPAGWNPNVVYIDPATNQVPAGLLTANPPTGIKTVDWYPSRNLDTLT